MPYGVTPPPQHLRPVGFRLSGGGASGFHSMALKPEELTWMEPSRAAAQNTLGDAWIDSWDRGIATLRILGHTGYRPVLGGGGELAFINLRNTVFQQWHDVRTAIARGGGDPNVVRLDFVDGLDLRMALLAPKFFTLKRSKTSPLLQRYHAEFWVLADIGAPSFVADPINAAINAATAFLGGAFDLEGIANDIGEGLADVGDAFGELFA